MTFDFTEWSHCKAQTLTLSETLTDKNILYHVYFGSGTDSEDVIYCDNYCNANFSDIRFTNASYEELPYWIEKYEPGNYADICVKVDIINSSSSVLMWYGNASAETTSSGPDTFIFFDDFSGSSIDLTTRWTLTGGTAPSLSDEILSSISYMLLNSQAVFSTNITIEYSVKFLSTGSKRYRFEPLLTVDAGVFDNLQIYVGGYVGTFLSLSTWYNVKESYNFDTKNYIWKIGDYTYSGYWTGTRTAQVQFRNGDTVSSYVGSLQVKNVRVSAYSPSEPIHGPWILVVGEGVYPLECTVSPTRIKVGETVTFVASAGYYYYCYLFPDGTMAYSVAATYVFDTPGEYTINLTSCLVDGSEYQNLDIQLTVYESDNVEFYAKTTRGKAPLEVMFINEYAAINGTFLWDFGDGNTSNLEHPIHTYTNAQDYTVKLTVTEDGISKTLIKKNYIHVTDLSPPEASFTHTLTDNSACLPVSVTFSDESTGTITESLWDFGDGITSADTNPVHIFTKAGYFLVRRIVRNADWEDVLTQLFYIRPREPTVRIYVSSASGTIPITVSFIPVIIGVYLRLEWDFGDGTTSRETNPTHTYSTAGTYTVTLSVYNTTSIYLTVATITITAIDPALIPDVAFSADNTNGEIPFTVNFTDASTKSPTTWLWDFGDGETSTERNPTHTYTTAGIYTVSLTATNASGSDTEIKTGYIEAGTDPIADFSIDSDINYITHTFEFTDKSLNNPTSWLWDFGDGETSTEQNPTHTYTGAQSYWVTLTVTNTYGTDTIGVDVVVVPESYPLPVFTCSTLNKKAPYTFTFIDASTGSNESGAVFGTIIFGSSCFGSNTDVISAWLWDFGDGETSTEQNPIHTYLFPGTYVVTLSVSNSLTTVSTTEVILDDN